MADYPEIPKQHDTDRKATALVDLWLADEWLHRTLNKDYGIDALLEPIVNGQPGGNQCFVQQKGMRAATFDSTGRLQWPMETKHLRYYLDRITAPVFLFVVDVENEGGWFCHIQAELKGNESKLAEQKTISIPLRLDSSIRDTARLRDAVNRAASYMRELHPGTIQSSFQAAVAQYDLTDPDFKIVAANVSGGRTTYTLAPKRDISLSISVPTKGPAFPKLEELFKFGRPLHLTTAEADFAGLAVFDKAKAEGRIGGIHFKPGKTVECEITLAATGADPFHLTIPGSLHGGSAGILLVAKLEGCPLGLEMKVTHDQMTKAGEGGITVTWDMTPWIGKELRSLPWIEPVFKFWNAYFAGEAITSTITHQGNRLVRGGFGRGDPSETFRPHFGACEVLYKLHELAVSRGWKLKVPDSQEQWDFAPDDITAAYEVEIKGVHERAAPNYLVHMEPAADNVEIEKLVANGASVAGHSKLMLRPHILKVFGHEVEAGDVECEAGPITIRKVESANHEGGLFEIRGEESTRLSMRRIPPCAEEAPQGDILPSSP